METVRLPIPTPRALVRPRSRLLSHVHPLAPRRAVAVFITDTMNNAIRRMRIDDPNRYAVDTVWSRYSSSYAESSIVCDGGVCGSVPGNVSGLWSPMAVAVWDVDGMFALLIADTDNNRLQLVAASTDSLPLSMLTNLLGFTYDITRFET